MNWKRAPELIEYLLMYPLILPKLMKKLIYSENIFFWCNILPLGKSAVTLMPGLKLCLNLAVCTGNTLYIIKTYSHKIIHRILDIEVTRTIPCTAAHTRIGQTTLPLLGRTVRSRVS